MKAGKAQICDKAKYIRDRAKTSSNPVAKGIQLNECLLSAPTGCQSSNARPRVKITTTLGHRVRSEHNVPSYHLTWCAANGCPDTPNGHEYSHRCHQPSCVQPLHGVWESSRDNKRRNVCANGKSHMLLRNQAADSYLIKLCPHEPECLSGTVVENMQHPTIKKLSDNL